MTHTIRWKLISGSLIAIIVPLAAVALFLASLLWQFYLEQLAQDLRAKAYVIADFAAPILSPSTPDDPAALARIVERWKRFSSMRVTIVDNRGKILAATAGTDVGAFASDSSRPGLRLAARGKENSTVWKNPTYGYEDSMYINVPVLEGKNVIGAVRVAYTLTQIQHDLHRVRRSLIASMVVYAALIITLTLWRARTIVRPVEELNTGAQFLAAGKLDHRIHLRGTVETEHLADTLNQMAQRLQELEGARRQYVSDVSHELRTPLAAIRSMAETILEHGSADPDLSERYLPRIVSQTERLARLASQVLDLTRIESGVRFLHMDPVSVSSAIAEAAAAVGPGAAAKGVRTEVDAPALLPLLRADHDRLVQVFLNLMDNAIRHTPSGGSVRVHAWRDGSDLVATVTDTGVGIEPEHLPKIFDRFYRVDHARSRSAGGSGLGLAIVKEIVERHGGTISAESQVGEGTRFTIRLPIVSAAPS